MYGTITTSIDTAESIWTHWTIRYGLDAATIVPSIHGQRPLDTIRETGLQNIDPEAEAELADLDGVVSIPGADYFLRSLPSDAWAIVTSAPFELAAARLVASNLPLPAVIVSAEHES